MISNLPSKIQQQIELIRPTVEERFAKMEEYGEDWDDKPVCRTIVLVSIPLYDYMADSQNDLLMWLMAEAKGVERSVEGLALRMLTIKFSAIHTTSMASVPSPTIIHS